MAIIKQVDALSSDGSRLVHLVTTATAAPAVTDDYDKGYDVGARWYDNTNGKAWECVDNTVGAAVWAQVSTETTADDTPNPAVTDTIAEETPNAGVTVDGVKLKDSEVYSDVIKEKTGGAGVTADGVLLKDGAIKTAPGSSAVAKLLALFGSTLTEGMALKVIDEVVPCTALENNLTNVIPKGAAILGVFANVQAALTGGGTTATWSVGVNGDVDKYGTAGAPTQANTLAKNSKSRWVDDANSSLGADEQIAVCAAAAGGAAAGDTALTVGSVRVMVVYLHWEDLANAA